MEKKGQVTIFIIIALLIIAGVILFFGLKGKKNSENLTSEILSFDVSPVREVVESCLEQTLEEGILDLGLTGGYFYFPDKTISGIYGNVPLYKTPEKENFPTKEILGKELVKYVDGMADLCLDFSEIEGEYNLSINRNISSEISLSEKEIGLTSKIPIIISKKDKTSKIEDFSIEVNSGDLLKDFEIAKLILDSTTNGEVCVNCFSEELSKNNLLVRDISKKNSTFIFEITDSDYILSGEEYKLIFGVQYA